MSRLTEWRGHAWLGLLARLYLGGLFLLACGHKILHPADFALDVAMYQLLPLELINLFAITLPWIELLAGGMLLLALRTRAAALLVSAMLAMFIIALVYALSLGLEMGCGCFASTGGDDPISWLTVLRDTAWLLLAVYVLIFDRRPLGVDRLLSKEPSHA